MSAEFFNHIKQEVDLIDFLIEHMQVDLSEEPGGKFSAVCPFHEESTPSFHVYPEDNGYRTYHCFGCSVNGTVIDAVMESEGYSQPMDAAIWLDQHYELGLEYDEEGYQEYRERLEVNQERTRNASQALHQDDAISRAARKYLTQVRRLDESTIGHFGIGVDTSKVKQGRVHIPFLDKAGADMSPVSRALFDQTACKSCREIVKASEIGKAAQAWMKWAKKEEAAGRDPRREDAEVVHWATCPHCGAGPETSQLAWLRKQFPKYMFERGFDAREHLYNEYNARQAIRIDQRTQADALVGIFVVEGYGDAWAAHQAGHPAVIAYNGSSFKPEQLHKVYQLYQDAQGQIPVILVPDFDKTGLFQAPNNIQALWSVAPTMPIKVIDSLPNKPDGTACKDLGDVLAHHGPEELDKVLRERAVSAYEWLIHRILDRKNKETGKSYYDRQQQMRLIGAVLNNVTYEIEVEALIGTLSRAWDNMNEVQVRQFVKTEIAGQSSGSAKDLMATIDDMQEAAYEYLKDKFVIKHGFPTIDHELPGGGARLRQVAMFIGKSGTGKTMLCLQLLMNMARQGIRCIFFTLEQPRAQIYLRMVSQVLGVDKYEAERLVEEKDERLNELRELFKNLVVIDNVPSDPGMDTEDMTVGKIARTINDLNVIHFTDGPVQVVAVDHLGQMAIDPKLAPKDVVASDTMAPGYIMQEMAKMTKALNVYSVILNQLPKNVPEGVEFPYDAGRGGSKQTDNCDYIYTIWRPDREHGIPEDEVIKRAGQYRLRLSKNRHGASITAYLKFEGETGRIVPDEDWAMRFDMVEEPDDGGENEGDSFTFGGSRTQVSMIEIPVGETAQETRTENPNAEPWGDDTEPTGEAEPPVQGADDSAVEQAPGEDEQALEDQETEEEDELLNAAAERAASRLSVWVDD